MVSVIFGKACPGSLGFQFWKYFWSFVTTKKGMLTIKKKYITNKARKRVAVQLDIKTFEKIEQLLEDYVLKKKITENDQQDRLSVQEARVYYTKLKKGSLWKSFITKISLEIWLQYHPNKGNGLRISFLILPQRLQRFSPLEMLKNWRGSITTIKSGLAIIELACTFNLKF